MNGHAPATASRFARNDHPSVPRPGLGSWTPSATVSVVVPAYSGQDKLDLLLAALAAQTYPEALMDVVVLDDGSEPPLRLPDLRPARTRLVRAEEGRWGIASAVAAAIDAAEGEVVLRLDADLVPARGHVEAHARWHAAADYLVVVGKLAFADVAAGDLEAARVREAVAAGRARALFGDAVASDRWQIGLVRDSGGEVVDELRAFTIANGATISFTRSLYRDCGGIDTAMPLGSDTELGYRLAQAGALFVPDPEAEVWHLGVSQMNADRNAGKRFRHPYLANRVPSLRYLRWQTGRTWAVPYVEVLVEVGGASLEAVRSTVGSVLGGSLGDAAVALVGPWSALDRAERVAPLADALLDLRLVRESFDGDARVRFLESAPASAAPAPFRLTLPPGAAFRYDGLERLVGFADAERAGRVRVGLAGPEGPGVAVLDRTAALARAERCRAEGEAPDAVLDAVWGVRSVDGDAWFAVAEAEPLRRLRMERGREVTARLAAELRLKRRIAALTRRPRRLSPKLRKGARKIRSGLRRLRGHR
ncbi:glycosyltransferase family 2 protein [Glycomyces sp. NRRL B-16210]|uniref:glycosyltransferase n=1 Tax=Glycomyces sp. NRRL B-16210 TaxID=1463821 RepID=UPI0006912812|nr:glycosyltransferase family 2 protein [Glycomyces sp. NRRL B-16210]